jgi:hypothetical protein
LEKCATFVKKVENFGLFCFFIKKKGKKFWWFQKIVVPLQRLSDKHALWHIDTHA